MLPTADRTESDPFRLTVFSALGARNARVWAIVTQNQTTQLRVTYNGSHFLFRYYLQALFSLTPLGGPARVSTGAAEARGGGLGVNGSSSSAESVRAAAATVAVSIFGVGLDALVALPAGGSAPPTREEDAAAALRMTRCKFGTVTAAVISIAPTFSGWGAPSRGPGVEAGYGGARYSTARCVPPAVNLQGGALAGARAAAATVEVTMALNGLHFVSARPPLTYTYYTQVVSSVHPTGGPIGGGTLVTLRGVGFDALADDGASLRCMFGSQRVRVQLRTLDGAAGAQRGLEVRCVAPPRHPFRAGASVLSLSLNAHHFLPTPGEAAFRYYENPRVQGLVPTGGPVRGGTHVTVHGSGFDGLGRDTATAKCKFGELSTYGRVLSISEDGRALVCASPMPGLEELGCVMPPPPLPPPMFPPPSSPPMAPPDPPTPPLLPPSPLVPFDPNATHNATWLNATNATLGNATESASPLASHNATTTNATDAVGGAEDPGDGDALSDGTFYDDALCMGAVQVVRVALDGQIFTNVFGEDPLPPPPMPPASPPPLADLNGTNATLANASNVTYPPPPAMPPSFPPPSPPPLLCHYGTCRDFVFYREPIVSIIFPLGGPVR